MRIYGNVLAVAFSVLCNAVLGGRKYEMLSTRAYRCAGVLYWYFVMLVIDKWFAILFRETDHCKTCWEHQKELLKFVEESE